MGPILHGRDYGAVTVCDFFTIFVVPEHEAQQRAHLRLQHDLFTGQPGGLRRRGELDVEAAVDAAAGGGVLGGRQVVQGAPQRLEVVRFRALRREPGSRSGHGRPVVAQVTQFLGAPFGEPGQQPFLARHFGQRHEAAATAPAPRGDQSLLAQGHQGLAQGDRGHAELSGQLHLSRQLLAVGEQPELDGVADPVYDRLDARAVVHGSEDGSADAVAPVLLHGHHLVR